MVSKEDIEKYLRKSGDQFIYEDNIVVNDHGFMSWMIDTDGSFVALNVYGDGEYWDSFIMQLAEKLGCTKARFATRRNPKAFERKFGYKIAGYIMEKEV
jgi:outer membrane protein assembly factor BamB